MADSRKRRKKKKTGKKKALTVSVKTIAKKARVKRVGETFQALMEWSLGRRSRSRV